MLSSPEERFNLLAPDVRADPAPLYHRLLDEAPVSWSAALSSWVIVRYRDVAALLRDARLSSNRVTSLRASLPEADQAQVEQLLEAFSHWMVFLDPPDHTRLRAMINRAFTPRLVASMRPRIQAVVDSLLDAACERGQIDIVQDLAYPLPTIVIAELLGARVEDRWRFKAWADDVARFASGRRDLEILLIVQRAVLTMTDYFRDMLARGEVREDSLLGNMLAPDEHGQVAEREDILATTAFLMFAGHETTTNLIANGIYMLLTHPAELARLSASPELIGSAVEEVLRYASPVQYVGRSAVTDVTIGDTTIRAGQNVLLGLAASHRDAAQFADPDRFDIGRTENRHLAFGYGPHFCVGAALARLEGQIAIETALRRLHNPRLTTEPVEWKQMLMVRALSALPLTFDQG